jgi:hypothetical protein
MPKKAYLQGRIETENSGAGGMSAQGCATMMPAVVRRHGPASEPEAGKDPYLKAPETVVS